MGAARACMLERPLAGYTAPRAGFGLQARKRNIGVAGFADAVFRGVNAALRRKHVSQFRHVAVDWTIGHVHSGALGWVGLVSMGSIYYLIPRLFGRPEMYSLRLITLHFWLATVGIVLYIAAMWVAGVMQGLMWRAVGEDGTLTYTFVESVKASYATVLGLVIVVALTGLTLRQHFKLDVIRDRGSLSREMEDGNRTALS